MKIGTKLLGLLLGAVLMACQPKTTWDIESFGALADGKTVNTGAIQSAIDACSEAGGGTVLVKQGVYVTGTVLLKNNVSLHVAKGAQLIGSHNPYDYISIDPFVDATGQTRGKCLVGAADAQNVGIFGSGTIDGRGTQYQHGTMKKYLKEKGIDEQEIGKLMGDRPFLVRFVRTSGIKLNNIHLRQSAAWTLHFYQCNHIAVDGIDIYAHAHRNNDGIDFDSSHDALITNCNIDSGDDALCFKNTSPQPTYNVQVSGCTLKSNWGAIKFGTEAMGDFKNILVQDCLVKDTRGGGIKVLSVDGSNISNVTLRNITMDNVDMPIFVRLGERLRTYRGAPKQDVGSIKGLVFENIKASTRGLDSSRVSPPAGIFITGTSNHRIEDLTLKNIEITLPGGGTEDQVANVVPEDETRYPEFSFFGVLPAYGMMARHIENLSVQNLTIHTLNIDKRKKIVLQDIIHHNLKE